jgi:hypothetical protein
MFRSFTLMARSQDSWRGGSLHVLMWLHLLNDHSNEPYKTEWSPSEWHNLIDPIF